MRCRSLAFLAVLLMVPIAALAQTNPFDGLNARGRAYLDPSVYAQQKAQWLARVDAMPENVDVLEGAAEFFMPFDRPLAHDLFQRARDLEPTNPKWVQKLAFLHRLNASSGDAAEAGSRCRWRSARTRWTQANRVRSPICQRWHSTLET